VEHVYLILVGFWIVSSRFRARTVILRPEASGSLFLDNVA